VHILFLTDNFPPEGNAPATRTYEHSREWVKKGHKVTVITGAPNFPEGKVFNGYTNSWFSSEYLDGIEVRRVKTYITSNEGFIGRVIDFMSFMVTSFVAGFFVSKPDVIIGTSPQLFTVVGAWLLSVFRRKPFVFELRDIWPASITAVGAMKKSFAIRILEKLELFLYHRADKIISVTNSFKRELDRRGVNSDKINVVLNGVDLSKYKPAVCKDVELVNRFSLQGKFIVGYIGTHGLAHRLDTIVDAAELLKDEVKIQIVLAGGGADRVRIENLVAFRGLKNISFLPRQPKEMMPRLWSICDVSLVTLKDTPLFETVIPSKIFESMGMGLPIIMSVPSGEASEIILNSSSGILVPPESPEAIAHSIRDLYSNPGKCAELAENSYKASANYDRKILANDMLNFICQLFAKGK